MNFTLTLWAARTAKGSSPVLRGEAVPTHLGPHEGERRLQSVGLETTAYRGYAREAGRGGADDGRQERGEAKEKQGRAASRLTEWPASPPEHHG